jgi:CDP-diglyceride synthetase
MKKEKGDSVSKFLKRTIITVTLILFLLADIYLFPSWLFSLITIVFIALGLCEFFNMVEKKDIFVYKYFGTVIGCLIPIFVLWDI